MEFMLKRNENYPKGADQGDIEDDEELVQAAQKSPSAFTPLYRRYVTKVYRYIYSRVGNVHETEDLTAQCSRMPFPLCPGTGRREISPAGYLHSLIAVALITIGNPNRSAFREVPGGNHARSDGAGGDRGWNRVAGRLYDTRRPEPVSGRKSR